MDPDENDGVSVLERAIDSDLQLIRTLEKRIACWAERDPAAAAEWVQAHIDDPRLKKSNGSVPIGEVIWDAIVPGIARTDPALAITQLDELGSRAKWTTVAAVAGSIIARGAEGDFDLVKFVLLRLDADRRIGGISVASEQPMGVDRLDAFAELVCLFDFEEK